MPAEPLPNVRHLQGHVKMMAANCQNLEFEVRRLEHQRADVEVREGGPIGRQRAIQHLCSQGLDGRARAQELKRERYQELWHNTHALIRRRAEAEMGISGA